MPTESTPDSSLLGAGHNHSQCFNPEARTKKKSHKYRISRSLDSSIFCVELFRMNREI